MKDLIPLLKEIELNLRSNTNFNKRLYNKLSNLTDWEYRIIQDFKLRVNLHINNNNDNFVYKFYEKNIDISITKNKDSKLDLLIVSLKRDKIDTVLTDVYNRVPIPQGMSFDYLEIWGQQVTQARNFAVKEALKRNTKYLLFIDDDIIAPQGSIIQLFDTLNKTKAKVVAGQYYRKMEPLMSAHGKLIKHKDNLYTTDMCAMGFTLIDLEYVSEKVPMPLFWEFGAPDGYWSMGEDAFFTKNFIEYTKQKPIVDLDIKLLHYDKSWKKWYGIRDEDKVYATNAISNLDQFERLRVPPEFPLIAIATPTREANDPIAVNLQEMLLLRGYRTEPIRIDGLMVDQARTGLTKHALSLNSDYMLFIDDDIIPPIDGLCKLLDHMEKNKEIGAVSGDYTLKGNPIYSAHLQLNKDTGIVTELDRAKTTDILFNDWLVGLGFCLIRMDFFKQAREPWFLCHTKNIKQIDVNEDAHFCELMFENGYKILIDRSIKCLHVDFLNKKYYGFDKIIDIEQYAYHPWINELEYIGED